MFRSRLLASAALCLAAFPALAQEAPPLGNDKERTSYAIGIAFGRSLIQQGTNEVNLDLVVRGMSDAFERKKLQLNEAEFRSIYAAFQKQAIGKMSHARQVVALENQQAGQKFLEENKSKPGVVQLPDGLQYKVIKTGTGPTPTDEDTVTANYRGTLVDGTEFDSTFKRNQPATFKMRGTIAGWREALKLMPVGSKWEIYVPAELAYSKQSVGNTIGPNAALIFEIELLSIEKKS
jgi:FKBP-type peptidyl-prolyl cis-trans isomerase FklB